jgi:hypothetical protein
MKDGLKSKIANLKPKMPPALNSYNPALYQNLNDLILATYLFCVRFAGIS